MTFEQIKELHSMGFTPDQITALTSSGVPTIPPDQGEVALTPAPVDRADSTAGDTSPLSSPVSEETPAQVAVNPPVNNPVETVDNYLVFSMARINKPVIHSEHIITIQDNLHPFFVIMIVRETAKL